MNRERGKHKKKRTRYFAHVKKQRLNKTNTLVACPEGMKDADSSFRIDIAFIFSLVPWPSAKVMSTLFLCSIANRCSNEPFPVFKCKAT